MKSTSTLLISSALLMVACSNDIKVPQGIIEKFEANYPEVENVEWEKEDGFYEAEWKEEGSEKEVKFAFDGSIIETTEEMAVEAIPRNIMDYLETQHPGKEIKEAEKLFNSEGIQIEIELEDEKGKETNILFTEAGKFIQQDLD